MIHERVHFFNVEELAQEPGRAGLQLRRFPRGLSDGLGISSHSRGRFFAHRAAGCELRFVSGGPFLRVHLSVLEQASSVLVYRGDHAHSRHLLEPGRIHGLFLEEPAAFAQTDRVALRHRRFAPVVWRILFHQDAVPVFHGIECFGHGIRPPHSDEQPQRTLLAYGSSISFGGNAHHPSNGYLQQAALRLGVDLLNKSLPGSCMIEPEMVDFLARLTGWDAAFLELGVNLAAWVALPEFVTRARHLLTVLRTAHPRKKLFVTSIYPNRFHHAAESAGLETRNMREFGPALREVVEGFGDGGIRFIEPTRICPDTSLLDCDLVHPSDEGHVLMGAALAAELHPLLQGDAR